MLALVLPLLSACSVSLRTHAQLAAVSAELLDATGAEIEREAAADVAAIEREGVEVARRKVVLQETYQTLEAAYEVARRAHAAYLTAIGAALERGDGELGEDLLRALLGAWRALAEAGDAVGVRVPPPPKGLGDLAGKLGKAGGRGAEQKTGGTP